MARPDPQAEEGPDAHPFLAAPNRTLLRLSVPVMLALAAEPVTGLVDTAFVARLGSDALSALGVGAIVLSSTFWIFNFLGVGTQTVVANARGRGDGEEARAWTGTALLLAALFGAAVAAVGIAAASPVCAAMGAEGAVADGARTYLRIRLLAAPCVLATAAATGALRGMQDMRTPLLVAVGVNAANAGLDAVLIPGLGPVPALGIAGAAWATAASQAAGAALSVAALRARLGATPLRAGWSGAGRLLRVGGDLFVRTGLLSLFLVLATRAATRVGAEAGAAHQVVRQVWLLTALVLDGFAASAQSLVGYFVGAARAAAARAVAGLACRWSLGTGVFIGVLMLLVEEPVRAALVPPDAAEPFRAAWRVAAWMQPLNALSFATDGIHWGTGDFRYLRDAMLAATALGAAGLLLLPAAGAASLPAIWVVTTAWIAVRAALGVLRIWPGLGASPLGPAP